MSRRRVAVIGGGLAGLAAGASLRGLGMDACIFECDGDVGGVVRTELHEGWLIESGPWMASEPDPAVRRLLDDAGVTATTVRADPSAAGQRYVVHEGVPVPVPRTLSEFSTSPLLSLAGRLRLVKERFIPARRDVTDESVDSFARRRFGDEVAERMFDPLVASTSAGDPRVLLARYAFPGTVNHEQRSGSGLQGNLRARMDARRKAKGKPAGAWSGVSGMQQVAHQLAAVVGDVRTNSRVDSVSMHDGKLQVVTNGHAADVFDAVIFATPAPALAGMAIVVPESQQLDQIGTIPNVSIAVVSLGFRREDVTHPLAGARLLVPSVERLSLLSVAFPSSLFLARAPSGHVLLTAYVGGARRPDLIDWPEEDLVALVRNELTALLGIRGPSVLQRVARWRDALPQAVAGHSLRLAAADIVEASAGTVAFTGAWRDGLSVSEVLLGGIRAAERMAVRNAWMTVASPE